MTLKKSYGNGHGLWGDFRHIMLTGLAILLIFGLSGCKDTSLQAVILSPGVNDLVVAQGEVVSFTGSAIGGVPFITAQTTETTSSSYLLSWDAEGNSLGADQNGTENTIDVTFDRPPNTEPDNPNYQVTLTVVDALKNKERAIVYVTVVPRDAIFPLQAMINSPVASAINVNLGETLTFTGSASGGTPFTDEDGTLEDPDYDYFWDTFGLKGVTTASVPGVFNVVDLTFSVTGVYPIDFQVQDSRGVKDVARIQVTVVLP